jgi:thiol:disulfide interchange protein DsbD
LTSTTGGTIQSFAPALNEPAAARSCAGRIPEPAGRMGRLATFLGGIILIIMPCVFPVISLKVMSFVGLAGEDRKNALLPSLVFPLAILVFFWLLTITMLVLRGIGGNAREDTSALWLPCESADLPQA